MKPQLEVISHELDSSIHAFKYENSHFDTPWHYHTEFELTYVVESSGIRYVGNSVENFYPGDLILIGSSLPHCWKNDLNYTGRAQSICIQWDHAILHKFILESVEFSLIQSLLNQSQYGVQFQHQGKENIASKLNAIISAAPGKKMIYFLDLLLSLSELSNQQLLSGIKNEFMANEQSDLRIQNIVKYVSENFDSKITIGNMAELTFMTETSFCKFFKRRFEKSFTNYLNEFRVRKVCQFLRESDKKLIEIAMNCGYENMSFFHRQFKKYLSCTPVEYRKHFS
ncbi:MAG: AraC family transcriptional regulator [Reichenbachiella sp.]